MFTRCYTKTKINSPTTKTASATILPSSDGIGPVNLFSPSHSKIRYGHVSDKELHTRLQQVIPFAFKSFSIVLPTISTSSVCRFPSSEGSGPVNELPSVSILTNCRTKN